MRRALPAAAVLLALWGCRHAQTAGSVPAPGSQDAATRAMAARLARLSDQYAPSRLFVNPRRVELLRAQLAREPHPSFDQRLAFAQELLNGGQTREALDRLSALRREAPPGRAFELESWLGIASLRLGEQTNCTMRHNADSCLLPIRGGGVHMMKEGAEGALLHFTRALRLRPDDLPSRWLLNIAAMTAGTYPAGVPARWLIPPSAFQAEAPFPRFPDRAAEAGLDFTGRAGGVVTEDFRGVGLLDVLISGQGLTDQLRYFRNNGDGTFTETTDEAGLRGITGGLNMIEGDVDNDGRVDVLVLRGAWQMGGGEEPLSLLHNDGNGHFSDVTEKAGLGGLYQTQAAAFADFDGDGRLDLLVCNEAYEGHSHPCRFFHGEPGGTFTDATEKVKLHVDAMVKSVSVGDYDDDGRPDVFIGAWGQGSVLLHQEADGTFRDATAALGAPPPPETFPSFFFDYDGDGRLDLAVFGFTAPRPGQSVTSLGYAALESVAADALGLPFAEGRPKLYHNNGDGTFTDVTKDAGLDRALFPMGANFADLDDDGYPDIYLGTGVPDLRTLIPNRLFRNDGGKRFLDVTSAADVGHLQKGHAIALGDLNNDGYPDIFAVMGGAYQGDTSHRALFVNPGGKNAWVQLTLEGTRSNRSALGARIRVTARRPDGAKRVVYGTVSSGGSFGCSGLRQTLGLGDAAAIESVDVRWPRPGAGWETFTGARPDAHWRLKEGTATAVAAPSPRFSWPLAAP